MARRSIIVVVIILVLVLAASWFYLAPPRGLRTAQPPAPPPPEVGVVTVQPAEVPFPTEYAGRVVGFRDVDVRPLVGGILIKRGFEEGAAVTQGQMLFQIDPAPFEVALKRAEAQLAQAQATSKQAEDNFTRVEELFSRKVSTERQRDDAIAARDQARASVQVAEAEIASAKLNLGYTTVNAPVAGVTALQSPAIGSLVQAQQTLLTTVTPLDPAFVGFAFTDEEGQRFQELSAGRAKPINEKDVFVDLQLGAGGAYPQSGKIDTAARRVDPQTGTIQARAIFPNKDGRLLPGQFVRVKIRGITLPNTIVIPKEAVSQGPQGPLVYAVGQNETAEVRLVRLGPELATGVIVREGLKGGDRIIVDGIIRVRPGAPVKAVAATAPARAAGERK